MKSGRPRIRNSNSYSNRKAQRLPKDAQQQQLQQKQKHAHSNSNSNSNISRTTSSSINSNRHTSRNIEQGPKCDNITKSATIVVDRQSQSASKPLRYIDHQTMTPKVAGSRFHRDKLYVRWTSCAWTFRARFLTSLRECSTNCP